MTLRPTPRVFSWWFELVTSSLWLAGAGWVLFRLEGAHPTTYETLLRTFGLWAFLGGWFFLIARHLLTQRRQRDTLIVWLIAGLIVPLVFALGLPRFFSSRDQLYEALSLGLLLSVIAWACLRLVNLLFARSITVSDTSLTFRSFTETVHLPRHEVDEVWYQIHRPSIGDLFASSSWRGRFLLTEFGIEGKTHTAFEGSIGRGWDENQLKELEQLFKKKGARG